MIIKLFNKKGFTLIELIVVVAILSIISTGALAILNPVSQIQKARDAQRKSDLAQIQRSLENYYNDNGKYPEVSSTSGHDYRVKGLDGSVINWGSSWQPYMEVMPKDPASNKNYAYYSTTDQQAYYLYASLDRDTDPNLCNHGSSCDSIDANGISDSACGGICNFGLSSPNVTP